MAVMDTGGSKINKQPVKDGWISFRVDKTHRQQINSIAKMRGVSCSVLFRQFIESLTNKEKSGR